MFGWRRRRARDAEIEALRLLSVKLLTERAKETPDAAGWLASRFAEMALATADPGTAAWHRHDKALREIRAIFDAAQKEVPDPNGQARVTQARVTRQEL